MKIRLFIKYSFSIVSIILLSVSCKIIQQGAELKTFSECTFTVQNVDIINIAGIDVKDVNKINDISINNYLLLVNKAFSSEMPSELEINIKAFNSNDKRAFINGLDWELYIKGELYSNGVINKPVEVLSHQSASFKLLTNFNLNTIIHSKSLPKLLAVIIEKNNLIELSDLEAVIRIKPWYSSGSTIKKYPGYINIRL